MEFGRDEKLIVSLPKRSTACGLQRPIQDRRRDFSLRGISKRFGRIKRLQQVGFVDEGEFGMNLCVGQLLLMGSVLRFVGELEEFEVAGESSSGAVSRSASSFGSESPADSSRRSALLHAG